MKLFFHALTFCLILFGVLNSEAKKISLRVSEFSTVKAGASVRLGDLLAPDKNVNLVEDSFYDLVVGEGVNSEDEQIISSQIIATTLRQNLSFQELQKYSLVFPEKVVVKARRNFLSKSAVQRQIYMRAKQLCRSCQVEIDDLQVPEIKTNDEILTSEINFENFRNAGSFMLPVNMETSKGRQQKIITGKVSLFKDVLVANRLLQMGSQIVLGDFETKSVNLNFAKDAVAEATDIEGKIMAKTVSMGQPVFVSDLKNELAAIRGQNVKVIIAGDSFEVSVNGVAEQSGSIGELIRVKNTTTNKIMSGTIIEKGTVRVE